MPEAGFSISTREGVACLRLERPQQHNALGAEDIHGIGECLDSLAHDGTVRALLLTGSGEETFCSGASLKELASGRMSGELFSTLTDRLAALPLPAVCALNGNAWGGGAELALCCDVRIGVEGMRLRVPAARIGLCYPVEGLRRYAETLGLDTARRILVAAEEFDTATLLATRFLHRAVPREALESTARSRATELAALAPLAVRTMKQLLGNIARGELDPAAAEQAIARCATSDDLQEGLAAQRERRPPRFEGR
jgi:enoyl-CoA hydratase/carnithine racemase